MAYAGAIGAVLRAIPVIFSLMSYRVTRGKVVAE
jgi:hypothetical protein